MDTRVQLFWHDGTLTTTCLHAPCLALLENDSAFSLLIARSARRDDLEHGAFLEQVEYFRAKGKTSARRTFACIHVIQTVHGIWIAQDVLTGFLFHTPSVVPYQLIFIPKHEFEMLVDSLEEGRARRVFSMAQEKFGRLPGFAFTENTLTSPDNYATVQRLEGKYTFFCPK